MSIPPLVCSTPPPPDQCEEDRDLDDFVMNYTSPNEDEDDCQNYDYGDFSTFSHFQSSQMHNKSQELSNTKNSSPTGDSSSSILNIKNINEQEIIDHTKIRDDSIIEDLNLEVSNQSSLDENNSSEKKHSISTENISNIDNISIEKEIYEDIENDIQPSTDSTSLQEEPVIDDDSSANLEKVEDLSEIESKTNDEFVLSEMRATTKLSGKNKYVPSTEVETDDFGDFNDFNLVSPNNEAIDNISQAENPWESNNSKPNTYGDFKANFDDISCETTLNDENVKMKSSSMDDDFGDFDDFQSSSSDNKTSDTQKEMEFQDIKYLNRSSQDYDPNILENIEKLINSTFEQEISESDNELGVNLESLLCEAWSHLKNVDERQPYIVNWSSSLAQKILLKALCIDSRNLLFGPRCGHNMPKFAAAMSAAPLQPQKQASKASDSATTELKDKSTASSWNDPFTNNGQEFTYAESLLLDLEHLMATLDQMAHNHSTVKISELLSRANSCDPKDTEVRTIDINELEAVLAKPAKIYSTAPTVQPIRQISLPDTHIFTPTDSEIPLSKTIHYDSGPQTILQPTVENNIPNSKADLSVRTSVYTNIENDTDYSEFQDYREVNDKCSSHGESSMAANVSSRITVSQDDILEPVKVESTVPTLNWPSPGDVKECFEDFSDFQSNISWNSNEKESVIQKVEVSSNARTDDVTVENNNDDDFDTFQSALPAATNNDLSCIRPVITGIENIPSTSLQTIPTIVNNISSSQNKISKETKINNHSNEKIKVLNSLENNFNTLSVHSPKFTSSILQPTSMSSMNPNLSQQQPTAQILQPLSLENYSQINWPNPGIDLQDLSKFNPVENLHSFKSDLIAPTQNKTSSPIHQINVAQSGTSDEDIWGDFVSSNPKNPTTAGRKAPVDDDEWTDFISSSNVKPQNGVNTISFNVHSNLNLQKTSTRLPIASNHRQMDIPTLNYVTPKTQGSQSAHNDRHFQNL